MEQKGNFTQSIHNEHYDEPYDLRNLNADSLVFIGGRQGESLNGQWRYVEDLYDVGFRDSWHKPRKQDQAGPAEPWDFHPDDGLLTQIPGCWNRIEPELFYFEGTVWYSREFAYVPQLDDERMILRIGAANYDTKIYLNGRFLGSHRGGSTPFCVDLSESLKAMNTLLIGVNNQRTTDRVPMRNTDWYNWGGIYRDIELYRLPEDHIRDFRLALVPDGKFNKIRFSCRLSSSEIESVRLVIQELNILQNLAVSGDRAECVIEIEPQLWAPDNPVLYKAELTAGDDHVEDLVGFREIRVRGTEVFLNGRKIFLRGVSVHEDDARNGKFLSIEDLDQRFRHAKELGANFLRLAHYPHDEQVARKADREGFLLWEEIPVYWAIDFTDEKTFADAENQLRELIARDYNRASVAVWSVGNENQDTDERLSFMKRLVETSRREDGTRLVTAACLVNHERNLIEDRLAEALDIIGLNEYFGWYEPDFRKLGDLVVNSSPEKPVIISEFGAGALAGHHGTPRELFTEEHQNAVYQQQIATIRNLEYICGMTPWILYDFTCPRRKNRYQRGYNRKGLIAEDKQTKKKAFQTLASFYREMTSLESDSRK